MKPTAPNERMASWLEQAWLHRYLDRKLDPDESEWFEVYALDKPELIAAIEADNDLRDGMAIAGAAGSEASPSPLGRTIPRPRRRMTPMLAWAASAVVGVGLGWVLAMQLAPPSSNDLPDIIASPTRIVFDTMRGVEDAPQIYPGSPDSQWVLVEVGLPADAESIAQLLFDEEPGIALSVSSEGFVSFLVPRSSNVAPLTLTIRYSSDGEEESRPLTISPSP